MNKKDDEFLKRLRRAFVAEAKEHMRVFIAGLSELEKTGDRKRIAELTEILFREMHSLKGAARSVDQKEIESLCQNIESFFSALKRETVNLTPRSVPYHGESSREDLRPHNAGEIIGRPHRSSRKR